MNAQLDLFAEHRPRAVAMPAARRTENKQHRRWQSKLMANKVVYHVGYFRTPEEAHEAYMRLKARLHLGGRSH